MADQIQALVNDVDCRLALNKQIKQERASGRNTMSASETADVLLGQIRKCVEAGTIPATVLETLEKGEKHIREQVGRAERSCLN